MRLTWPTFAADNDDDGYEEYNEEQDDDGGIPVPVRIGRAFFAGPYRGKQVVLSHEGGWWVCTIDDTTHAGHTAIGALEGWFAVWGHHSHGQCSAPAHACPFAMKIRGDGNPEYCNCCERCTDECRRDV